MSAIPSTLGPKPPAIRNCQDLRADVVVHHLALEVIHDLFDGQPVGRKATETLIFPPLAGEFPAMNPGQPRSEHLRLIGTEKRRQVGGPRIHPGENFTTAGNGEHTSTVSPGFAPANPPKHRTQPADREGRRLITARTRSSSRLATETQTPGPGDCLHEFQGRRWSRNPR